MNERPKACPACRGTVLIKSGHACGRQRWKCKGQASASFWMDTRKDATLAITTVPAARLRHVLDAAREAGCDLAIIDTPPCMRFTVSSVISSVRTQSAGRNRDRPRSSLDGAWPLHLVSGRPSQGT